MQEQYSRFDAGLVQGRCGESERLTFDGRAGVALTLLVFQSHHIHGENDEGVCSDL